MVFRYIPPNVFELDLFGRSDEGLVFIPLYSTTNFGRSCFFLIPGENKIGIILPNCTRAFVLTIHISSISDQVIYEKYTTNFSIGEAFPFYDQVILPCPDEYNVVTISPDEFKFPPPSINNKVFFNIGFVVC